MPRNLSDNKACPRIVHFRRVPTHLTRHGGKSALAAPFRDGRMHIVWAREVMRSYVASDFRRCPGRLIGYAVCQRPFRPRPKFLWCLYPSLAAKPPPTRVPPRADEHRRDGERLGRQPPALRLEGLLGERA